MKYFLIAGEASGDLHASHLMKALKDVDAAAQFRYYGGDQMQKEGGELLCHYKHLAYMGFIPVLLHLRTILGGMARCKKNIAEWQPDAVILVDYPGFNLNIARFVSEKGICPVYYYISPKIWAWKERRIKAIKRDVSHLYSILPFEVAFFEQKHHYPITYVGNPTVDEVALYKKEKGIAARDEKLVVLMPGSRKQEIKDNLSRMLRAISPKVAEGTARAVIAGAPSIPADFYEDIISRSGVGQGITLEFGKTYELLSLARAALVTSGTATLETALFRVPQVVCYYVACGRLVSLLRRLLLKVPYVSLVNLICNREVVPELVASGMTVENVRREFEAIFNEGSLRQNMLKGYEEMAEILGRPGAPGYAAADIWKRLKNRTSPQ